MKGIDVETYRPADHVPEPEPTGPVVTDPDPDYEDWDDEEVADLAHKSSKEHARRQRVASQKSAVSVALASMQAAQGIRDGQRFVQPAGYLDAIPADGTRWFEDGTIRRNISGGPLVHGPDDAPDAWETIAEDQPPPDAPDPDDYPDWSGDGVEYDVGDVVAYEGDLWEVATAHTSQPGWEPHEGYLWSRV